MVEATMQHEQLEAIQEAIVGFLREQVINPSGEFHYNPNETMIPNYHDHLYCPVDLWMMEYNL